MYGKISVCSKLPSMLLLVASCLVIICMSNDQGAAASDMQYSDLPPPPQKPERFENRKQLRDYLVKLHEYYAIIGRPRFGRAMPMENMSLKEIVNTKLNENNHEIHRAVSIVSQLIFDRLDKSQDDAVSREEFTEFLTELV